MGWKTDRAQHCPGAQLPARVTACLLSIAGGLLTGCSPSAAGAGAEPDRPGAFHFRDAAGDAGLAFRWGHGGRTPLTILDTLGHGAAFLDFDGDGLLDLMLVGDNGTALYRNRGEGRFEDVTRAAGADRPAHWHGIATGDWDNDGDPDVCLVGYRSLAMLRNDPDATAQGGRRFTDVTAATGVRTPGWGSSAGFADLDGDGRLDLVVGDYVEFGPESVQLCTSGAVRSACGPKIYPARFPRVYRNTGDGTFRDVTAEWGFGEASGKCLGVAFGDFNGDGRLDVALANDEMPQDLFLRASGEPVRFRNEGVDRGFAFRASGEVQSGMGVDAADYNDDGREDLIVTNFQNEAAGFYRCEGDFFTDVSARAGLSEPTFPLVGWGVRFLDADNDAHLDLMIANGHIQDNVHLTGAHSSYAQPLLLLAGEAGGRFRNVGAAAGEAFAQPFVGRGLAAGDYDNDGRVDVLVVDLEGAPRLLRNESPAGHHWLGLEVLEGSPPRAAIGALVRLEGAGFSRHRRVTTGGSIFSAHDPRVHFGLGALPRVERLYVDWPDGLREEFPVPEPDRYHRLARGAGAPAPRRKPAPRQEGGLAGDLETTRGG
jgi:hypothetical protein